MALPKIQVGEKTTRTLKKLAGPVSVVSAAFLYMFPIGALTMGLAYVSRVRTADGTTWKGHKRLRTLYEDFGELGHRAFQAGKSPWVAIPLAVTAAVVGVVPFIAFYVPTFMSTLSYGVHAILVAPAAILAVPASVHHFRALKRAQERKLGHAIRASEVKKGPLSVREHFGAEVGDAVALGQWTGRKAIGAVTNAGRLLGWTGKTWKSSWATSPTVRLTGRALGSSLKRLDTGARFVGRAVTLHHIRSLKAEVVELRAKVQVHEATVAKTEEVPQVEVATAAAPKSGLRKITGKRTTLTAQKGTKRRERKLEG